MSKLKHLQYFTAETETDEIFGGVIILRGGTFYALSDYDKMDSNSIPESEKLGFQYTQSITDEQYAEEYEEDSDIENVFSDTYNFKTCNKRSALRAIIIYRKNSVEVASYKAKYSGGLFEFGCGAVKVTPEEVKILLKVMTKLTDGEWQLLSNIIDDIRNEDDNIFANLKSEEKEINRLLKLPAYIASLPKKVAPKKAGKKPLKKK